MTSFKSTLLAGLLAGVALGGVPALAQDAPPPAGPSSTPWPRFDLSQFDADGDGVVTLAEIQQKRKAEVSALDANNDGKISAEEMANAEMARIRPGVEARAAARVKALDVDGDGLLSAAELAAPGAGMAMFSRMDANGDGSISPDEMKAMHDRMRPGKSGDRPRIGRGAEQGPRHSRDGHGQDAAPPAQTEGEAPAN